jgi:hypothetical protein
MSKYLTKDQINQMRNAALSNYEFSCDWKKAWRTAYQYSIDEFGVKPNRSAVSLAVKLAKVDWSMFIKQTKNQ